MARFAKDFGALPHFVSIMQLKSVFRGANLGAHADDRRGLLNESEFRNTVRRLVATVKDRMVDGATPMSIATDKSHSKIVKILLEYVHIRLEAHLKQPKFLSGKKCSAL